MELIEFVKKELSGWKKFETISLFAVLFIIFVNAIFVKDNPIAVISAFCGILYTVIAGKGKISCYFFGLSGSWCYVLLSFGNALWGNMLLYLCYYIPMQVFGIFKWKQHLKKDSKEIVKIQLPQKTRILLVVLGVLGSVLTSLILFYFNDKSPIADGIATFLSIIGMYLTVRRAIEQWFVWMIVNGISTFMWLSLVIHGTKTYSTVIMWGVYFVLAIYFYYEWKKELT